MRILPTLLLIFLLFPSSPYADVAPPWMPQGASIEAGEEPTFVQMLREDVTLTVKGLDAPEAQLAMNVMVALVEASFVMRNQGAATESMEVWFPLSSHDGGTTINAAKNFQVWVDGAPVAVEKAAGRDLVFPDEQVPWAKWPVTFSPGREVLIRVAYDVHPVGYLPWGTFTYILETGAGWYGPIGQGTVSFQLPYPINELNTELSEAQARYAGIDSSFEAFQVAENTLAVKFRDLEPSEKDNLRLSVLSPAQWDRVAQAFSQAEAQPDSIKAQKRLAQALVDAAWSKGYLLVESSSNQALAREIQAAYRRAMDLAPQDLEVRIAYLEWLERYGTSLMDKPVQARPVLDELERVLVAAVQIAPEEARLENFRAVGDFWRRRWQELDPAAAATVLPPTTLQATSLPAPPSTTPLPAAGTPVPTTMAEAETESGSLAIPILIWSGMLGLGILLILFWLHQRTGNERR